MPVSGSRSLEILTMRLDTEDMYDASELQTVNSSYERTEDMGDIWSFPAVTVCLPFYF